MESIFTVVQELNIHLSFQVEAYVLPATLFIRKMRGRFWTIEEREFLRENYGQVSSEDLAWFLKRTESAVRTKAYNIGVTKEIQTKKEMYDVFENWWVSKEVVDYFHRERLEKER